MSVSDAAPLPRAGEVFFDVRGDSRCMRLSWYADTGVAVFSIWQGPMCTGTFRLPMGELGRMIDTLRRGPQPGRPERETGGGHPDEAPPPGYDRQYGQDYADPRDRPADPGFPPSRGYGPDWPDPRQAAGWQPTVAAAAADLGPGRGRGSTRDLGQTRDLGAAGAPGAARDLGPGGGYQDLSGNRDGWDAEPDNGYQAERDRGPGGGYPASPGSGYQAERDREAAAGYDSDRFVPPYVADPATADAPPGDYFTRPGPDPGRAGWDQEPGTVAFPQSPSGRAFDTDGGQYRLGRRGDTRQAGGAARPARDRPEAGRIARDQFERDRFGAPYDRGDRADLLPPDMLESGAAQQPPVHRDTVADPDYLGYQGREPRPRHGRDGSS